jgi:hypothetical protein
MPQAIGRPAAAIIEFTTSGKQQLINRPVEWTRCNVRATRIDNRA